MFVYVIMKFGWIHVKFKKIISTFSDLDRNVWSNLVNLEPLTINVLLTAKTILYQKVKKPIEPGLNLTVLTVPPTKIFTENGRWLGSFIAAKSSNLI